MFCCGSYKFVIIFFIMWFFGAFFVGRGGGGCVFVLDLGFEFFLARYFTYGIGGFIYLKFFKYNINGEKLKIREKIKIRLLVKV